MASCFYLYLKSSHHGGSAPAVRGHQSSKNAEETLQRGLERAKESQNTPSRFKNVVYDNWFHSDPQVNY